MVYIEYGLYCMIVLFLLSYTLLIYMFVRSEPDVKQSHKKTPELNHPPAQLASSPLFTSVTTYKEIKEIKPKLKKKKPKPKKKHL